MNHKLSITTIEALLINKALGMDMQNDVDNAMAELIKQRINTVVDKDLKRQKPTDLSNKCGSCKWSSIRRASYINCNCPSKNPNFFARTTPKCKFYELKEKSNEIHQ